jgi:hypothetical protein
LQLNLDKLRDVKYCDTFYHKQQKKPKPEKKEDKSVEPSPANGTKQVSTLTAVFSSSHTKRLNKPKHLSLAGLRNLSNISV